MRKTRMEKGITLIALIITIVVLLILAVVTIGAMQDSHIIFYADKAKNDYRVADEKEQMELALAEWKLEKRNESSTRTFAEVVENSLQGDVEITEEDDGTLTITFNTGNSYILSSDGTITVKNNSDDVIIGGNGEIASGNSLVQLYKNGEIAMGTYIEYNPSTSAAPYTILASDSGMEDDQSVEKDELAWRVLGLDASGNNLLLISATPTNAGFEVYGHVGYNNYENILTNTCNALYSNADLGITARNLTMEDIRTYLGGPATENIITNFDSGSTTNNGNGAYMGHSKELTNIYMPEKWENTNNATLTHNAFAYYIDDEGIYEELVGTDGTKIELLMGFKDAENLTGYPFYYYVASRFTKVGDYYKADYAGWCVSLILGLEVNAQAELCNSDGNENTIDDLPWTFRPVVVIPSSVTTENISVSENTELPAWDDPLGLYQDSGESSS